MDPYRADKRPRPITLRMNVGDCLKITFRNLLDPNPSDDPSKLDDDQPYTRTAGVHVTGLQLVGSIASDGSNVTSKCGVPLARFATRWIETV